MVKSVLPPPKRFQSKEQKEKQQNLKEIKKYVNLVKILCKSSSLKDDFKTDEDRRMLIEMKYILSKVNLYKFLKDYANDPFNIRWRVPPLEHWYGGETCQRIIDSAKSVEFEIEYDPDTVDYTPLTKLPMKNEITVHVASMDSCQYKSRIKLEYLDSLVFYYVQNGVDDIKRNFNTLQQQQRELTSIQSITDLYK